MDSSTAQAIHAVLSHQQEISQTLSLLMLAVVMNTIVTVFTFAGVHILVTRRPTCDCSDDSVDEASPAV